MFAFSYTFGCAAQQTGEQEGSRGYREERMRQLDEGASGNEGQQDVHN